LQAMGGVRREPRVAAIDLWNCNARTIGHYGRTDNEVEGFHMKVAHTMGAQFPNLWKFFKGLQGLQVKNPSLYYFHFLAPHFTKYVNMRLGIIFF